jgi:hypothetical protein
MNLQCDVIVWVEPEGRGRTQELRTMCPINLHEKSEATRVAAESSTRRCRCRVPLTRSSTHGVSALPSARSSSSFTKTYVASGFPHACQKSQSSNRDRAPRPARLRVLVAVSLIPAAFLPSPASPQTSPAVLPRSTTLKPTRGIPR